MYGIAAQNIGAVPGVDSDVSGHIPAEGVWGRLSLGSQGQGFLLTLFGMGCTGVLFSDRERSQAISHSHARLRGQKNPTRSTKKPAGISGCSVKPSS